RTDCGLRRPSARGILFQFSVYGGSKTMSGFMQSALGRTALLKRQLIAAMAVVVTLFGTTQAFAQTLGCAANSITPSFGSNYGTSLDGTQTWDYIQGDPLMIVSGSTGGIQLYVCQPSPMELQYQYFGQGSWGT